MTSRGFLSASECALQIKSYTAEHYLKELNILPETGLKGAPAHSHPHLGLYEGFGGTQVFSGAQYTCIIIRLHVKCYVHMAIYSSKKKNLNNIPGVQLILEFSYC